MVFLFGQGFSGKPEGSVNNLDSKLNRPGTLSYFLYEESLRKGKSVSQKELYPELVKQGYEFYLNCGKNESDYYTEEFEKLGIKCVVDKKAFNVFEERLRDYVAIFVKGEKIPFPL